MCWAREWEGEKEKKEGEGEKEREREEKRERGRERTREKYKRKRKRKRKRAHPQGLVEVAMAWGIPLAIIGAISRKGAQSALEYARKATLRDGQGWAGRGCMNR